MQDTAKSSTWRKAITIIIYYNKNERVTINDQLLTQKDKEWIARHFGKSKIMFAGQMLNGW